MDEHRLGLKPITGRVWARPGPEGAVQSKTPIGERPIVTMEHRYEWLYVYAFACPEQGLAHFWIVPEVNTVAMNLVLAAFAKDRGASKEKAVLLVWDQAGYHIAHHLKVPEGVILVFLPSRSPELQPAEHLWKHTDIPLKNQHFLSLEHLENTLAPHLAWLETQSELLRKDLLFHWWPRTIVHL